jgi:mannose-1-phosphate guanylyltransferase
MAAHLLPFSSSSRFEQGRTVRQRWAAILAGGEGTRLRPLTEVIAGDSRPKQFCALLGHETLLEWTWRRAAAVIDPARIVTVLTRAHRRFFLPLVAGLPARCLVVQPQARGTAAAILYALARIAAREPTGAVAILPSDHWVSNDVLFMDHVEAAFDAVERRPDLVVLLGIAPEAPETDYGWIEPGEAIPPTGLRRVRRFWEKPGASLARALLERGGLWNSFVVVAGIPALRSLVRAAVPEMDAAFAALRGAFDTDAEEGVVARLYAALPSINFSDRVLAARPANLAVLPVRGVAWSDWGKPERVLATLAGLGVEPRWSSPAGSRAAWA